MTGLLYFHRISDNRMAGTLLNNLRVFEKLFEDDFNCIVLTTTMWTEVPEDLGAEREGELTDVYWKSMIERGSSVKRFLNTRQSAFEVMTPIFYEVHKRSALCLQRATNDPQFQPKFSSAGKTPSSYSLELEGLVARHRDTLEEIRRELGMADRGQLQFLMGEYQSVSVQLQRATEDLRMTRISMKERVYTFINGVDWRRIFG